MKRPLAIDILQRHTQDPMAASDRTPIVDALTRATEQHQNRLIAPGHRGVDQ